KAAKFVQNTKIKVAFVSTNSIVQGEQTSILWGQMLTKYGIKIHFAHRTFKWSNEAKGNAAVYCVIVGFANFDTNNKSIFEYEDIKGAAHELKVKNINPYLVDAKDILISTRKKPICNVPEMSYGSMANDGGNLLLNDEEKQKIIKTNFKSETFIKPFVGSFEFINNIKRWCIWLKDVSPDAYSDIKEITNKVREVQRYRLNSTRLATQKLASYPYLFGEVRQPDSNYLIVPGVSSENRKYIPIGYMNKEVIASDLVRTVPNSSLLFFGVLTSMMHMAWVKNTCGRLKSDFRYSSSLVYNNYPWPVNPTEKQKTTIEEKAQKVLDARLQFPNSSLANL
ncbi:MAG: class I SAM-dependent DNA methyltransferase, partial [Bacteroidota bacterium]|nr:class I SAM-dependent DNA methyltransferase [Bacteroidota bacterium]